jgi:hypothetical protein
MASSEQTTRCSVSDTPAQLTAKINAYVDRTRQSYVDRACALARAHEHKMRGDNDELRALFAGISMFLGEAMAEHMLPRELCAGNMDLAALRVQMERTLVEGRPENVNRPVGLLPTMQFESRLYAIVPPEQLNPMREATAHRAEFHAAYMRAVTVPNEAFAATQRSCARCRVFGPQRVCARCPSELYCSDDCIEFHKCITSGESRCPAQSLPAERQIK